MKKFLSVIAVSAAMLGGSALTASSAQAVGCYYSSCLNKSPVTMGCGAGAYVIGYLEGNKEVLYSPGCHAAWLHSSQSDAVLGFDFTHVMRTYTSHVGEVGKDGIHTVTVKQATSKTSNMIPLDTSQFIQVDINTGYYPQRGPMLNTSPA